MSERGSTTLSRIDSLGLGKPPKVEAQLGEGLAFDGDLPSLTDSGVAGGTANAAPASEDARQGRDLTVKTNPVMTEIIDNLLNDLQRKWA
ncbi:DEAH-box ATP-dependent RNA helicase prp22 [Hypoxylon texense]